MECGCYIQLCTDPEKCGPFGFLPNEHVKISQGKEFIVLGITKKNYNPSCRNQYTNSYQMAFKCKLYDFVYFFRKIPKNIEEFHRNGIKLVKGINEHAIVLNGKKWNFKKNTVLIVVEI